MTTTIAVLTVSMPREVSFHPRTCHSFRRTRRLWFQSQSSRPAVTRFPPKPSSALGSRSSLALSSVVEDDPSSSSTAADAEIQDVSQIQTQSSCKTCGRDEIENGCNGEGRIQGGIATIPGFGWWPIKAYRPCPGFLASGGNYRRRGQSMDEVAFGGGERRSRGETLSSGKERSRTKMNAYAISNGSAARKGKGPLKLKR